ncbi:MAG TPA: FAD-dependent oxidoreductase, partial [Steroidobacteraceae bacterium]|nr:FAD-dependent oxidoreductase [Steroidobacteraceae bacterium]
DIYPRIAASIDHTSAETWTALRPMSADGLPFIGPTHVRGLFVNAGHGHLGWTLAAGSANLIADLIAGQEPAIDPSPYRCTR